MNLIIDVGNTQIKVAVFQEDELQYTIRFDASQFHLKLKEIFQKFPEIQFSILSSVKNVEENWGKTLQQKTKFLLLSGTTKVPFQNHYKTPRTLGVDRMALAAAASKKFSGKNTLIIDAGTCITYDILNRKNEYLGGVISPGLQMRTKAMHQFTDKLPLVEINKPLDFFIGNTTETSLQLGVLKATSLEIDGFIEEYKNKFEDLTVILSGGDTEILSKTVKNSIFAPSNFLLEGLNQILEFNKS